MPDILHLRIGETRQLRAPPEGVARWTSSIPAVVTTTDEDLVTGNPGGLLTAIKPGRAKITAFAYDNKTTVCQWDVEVEAAATSTIRVEKGEVANLPSVPGGTHWTITNTRVAEIASAGRVRGISPGVAMARGQEEGAAVECSIEVTGTLNLTINQSIGLAEFFSCPVSSWRTSSPSEVPINSQGMVITGGRARTVEVFVELASGRIFEFKLRIGGNSHPAAPIMATTIDDSAAFRPAPITSNPAAMVGPDLVSPSPPSPSDQRAMVENHLRSTERCLLADNWTQAGAELTAARLTAVTDPELTQRVEQVNERLHAAVNDRATTVVADAIRLLLAGEYERVYRQLDSARVPRDFSYVAEAVRRLATLVQQAQSDGDSQTRDSLERELTVVWGEMARIKAYSALPPLAEVGLQHGKQIVFLLVDTLSNSVLSGIPIAVRRLLGKSLADASSLSLEIVVSKIMDHATPPATASLLLKLLPDLNLHRLAAVVIKRFAISEQTERSRLVTRISVLHKNSANTLLDLISGVVTRLPVDMRLALAIQKEIGIKELEGIARRWAVGGHRGARTVLERLYGYTTGAFL